MRVLVATRNPIKLEEIRHLVAAVDVHGVDPHGVDPRGVDPHGIDLLDVDLLEVQAVAPADVVRHKLDQVAALRLPHPVLVEDTGLALAAWQGLPGALIKWFVDGLGAERLAALLGDDAPHDAVATSAVGVAYAGETRVWVGSTPGRIVQPRGTLGGWTPVFEVAGTGMTLGEMPLEARLRHTMRREPLLAATAWLAERPG